MGKSLFSHKEAHYTKKGLVHIEPTIMFGTAEVKDLSNNTHYKNIGKKSSGALHAEENLVNAMETAWKKSQRKLQEAKMTIFMHTSPCKGCFGKALAWQQKLQDAICPHGTLFLTFAFKQYYDTTVATSGANREHVWAVGKAEENYIKLSESTAPRERAASGPGKNAKMKSLVTFIMISGQRYYKMGVSNGIAPKEKAEFKLRSEDFPSLPK